MYFSTISYLAYIASSNLHVAEFTALYRLGEKLIPEAA